MIIVNKSSVADTRTCDPTKVTRGELLNATFQHIGDVQRALAHFCSLIHKAGRLHDKTKLSAIELFHTEFVQGTEKFVKGQWWPMHKQQERHHLSQSDGIRDDVNLIDVLEYIADCVMAGKARSGKVNSINIDIDVLAKAFQNTCALLDKAVVVEE